MGASIFRVRIICGAPTVSRWADGSQRRGGTTSELQGKLWISDLSGHGWLTFNRRRRAIWRDTLSDSGPL